MGKQNSSKTTTIELRKFLSQFISLQNKVCILIYSVELGVVGDVVEIVQVAVAAVPPAAAAFAAAAPEFSAVAASAAVTAAAATVVAPAA